MIALPKATALRSGHRRDGWRARAQIASQGAGILALLAGAIVWEVVGRLAQVSFFPPLTDVLQRLWELILAGDIHENIFTSLSNLAVGFSISLVFGTAIGSLMGLSRRVEAALDIYVYTLLTTPTLVFAPIFFSIFGLGREVIIAVIVMYSIHYVIINTITAVRAAPIELLEMAQSYNATRQQVFRKVLVPAAIPLLIAGLRVAVAHSAKGMINGEMFIAAVGLGAIVIRAGARFDATTVLAVLIVIIIVAFSVVGLVSLLDRRLTSWLPSNLRNSPR